MKTYKLMFSLSAILAALLNPNWIYFFIVAMCMSFVDYFYLDQKEDKQEEEKQSGGGAMGW